MLNHIKSVVSRDKRIINQSSNGLSVNWVQSHERG